VTPVHHSYLILGGARSGKSRHALAAARSASRRTGFIATAEAVDSSMRERITRHKAERPRDWITMEEPLDVVLACRRLARRVDLIVVDCLTVWVSNQMARALDDDTIISAADGLAKLMCERLCSLILVSNEVGEGVHPPTEIGLRFRDVLGSVNQCVAAAADRVSLMVAGIPLEIKRAAPPPAESESHERPVEAP
jgi:adenosylcobinamide kinase/adenosylcobinamide-phosphate guanylyltransferase